MKKVLYFNFNVGSAIEYVGNIFSSWLGEINNIDVVEIKEQDQPSYIIDKVIKVKPDIIIMNELYNKSSEPSFYYKKFYPDTKIIFLNHSWKEIFYTSNDTSNDEEKIRLLFNSRFYRECDVIINLNSKPQSTSWPVDLNERIINGYFPVDLSFKNVKPWKDREHDFVILGNVYALKISVDFLKEANNKGLKIHCYGKKKPEWGSKEYFDLFEKCNAIQYMGEVKQEEVSEILNKYKYFVMPHDGYEIFNVSLLQAIKCGTIPLISNDRDSTKYDYTWIDWASGLYFGCNTAKELVNNMVEFCREKPDQSEISTYISNISNERFSYDYLRNIFTSTINDLVNGGY